MFASTPSKVCFDSYRSERCLVEMFPGKYSNSFIMPSPGSAQPIPYSHVVLLCAAFSSVCASCHFHNHAGLGHCEGNRRWWSVKSIMPILRLLRKFFMFECQCSSLGRSSSITLPMLHSTMPCVCTGCSQKVTHYEHCFDSIKWQLNFRKIFQQLQLNTAKSRLANDM